MECAGVSVNDPVTIQRIICERFEIGARRQLAEFPGLRSSAEFDVQMDLVTSSLIVSIRTWALKGVEGHCAYLEKPASWWQHFKEEWGPAWLVERWPVRYTQMPYTSYRVCPHSDVRWPDQRHMEFLSYHVDPRS